MYKPDYETRNVDWTEVKDFILKGIDAAHVELENPKLDEQATNVIRGRIEAYRRLLALERADAKVVPPTDNFGL